MTNEKPSPRFLAFVLATLWVPLACSSERSGGPTAPTGPDSPIDPMLASELRTHVDDPLFQVWLPGHLGNQEHARPIHALVHGISRTLAEGNAAALRRSLEGMPAALGDYRTRPGHPPRDETILSAIEICVQEILAILGDDPGRSPPASTALSKDRG